MRLVRRKAASKAKATAPSTTLRITTTQKRVEGSPTGQKRKNHNTHKRVYRSKDKNMQPSEQPRNEIEPPEETNNLKSKLSRRFKYKTTGN